MDEGIYTITPSMPGYTFTPPSQTVTVPPDHVLDDFVGTLIETPVDTELECPVPFYSQQDYDTPQDIMNVNYGTCWKGCTNIQNCG